MAGMVRGFGDTMSQARWMRGRAGIVQRGVDVRAARNGRVGVTEMNDRQKSAGRDAPQREKAAGAGLSEAPDVEVGAVLGSAQRVGLPPGAVGRAELLFLQRTVGNRAATRFVGRSAATVQRKPSLSGLKKAVGVGKKPSAAAKAEKAGIQAKSAKVVTVSELEKQISMLESATSKLVKAHHPGDTMSHKAAFEVQGAAQRITRNLGRTYPDHAKRLGRIIDETQLILDEIRVENTRRQAQNVYHEAGRTDTRGQQGALTKLTVRDVFDKARDQPAPNAEVVGFLKERGFATYEQAFDDALAKSATDSRMEAERHLARLQPELFGHTERSRSRAAAQTMGLSPAELAAIQTFSAQDYRYINPATANDPAWLAANYSDLVDDPKTLEEWAELQDQLAAAGHTLDQRLADRRKDLTALREEGGLHTGIALTGLQKMPVWKGVAYRGEAIDEKRFYPRFVKNGDGFRPRNPTFTWKTITSISKDEHRAKGFKSMGHGSYRVLWKFEVINGRDIEGLSINRTEREVALLPGAEFAYGEIKVVRAGKFVEGFGHTNWELEITAKQIK